MTRSVKLGVIPGERSEGRGSLSGWGARFPPPCGEGPRVGVAKSKLYPSSLKCKAATVLTLWVSHLAAPPPPLPTLGHPDRRPLHRSRSGRCLRQTPPRHRRAPRSAEPHEDRCDERD